MPAPTSTTSPWRSASISPRAEEGEEVDTVGGLVVNHLGRVPVRGELVTLPEGIEFEILDADPRRIKRLRIYQRPAEPRRRPRRRKPRTIRRPPA